MLRAQWVDLWGCSELNGRICRNLEDKHAEGNVDDGYLTCEVSEGTFKSSLKALSGPWIFLPKNHPLYFTGTMGPGHLWLKNQLQSRRQNFLGSISSASSCRNCRPELGEEPSHVNSQVNSVRVTQVVWF